MSENPRRDRGGVGGLIWGAGAGALLAAALLFPACEESEAPAPTGVAATTEAGPAGGEVRPPLKVPGWLATLSNRGQTVKAVWATPALALGPGESPDPGVAPAGFTATLAGTVQVEAAGRYRFVVQVEGGDATFTAFDQAAKAVATGAPKGGSGLETDWVNLAPQGYAVSVKFTRSGDSAARLRVMWEKEGRGDQGFALEPIPLEAANVSAFARADALQAERAHRGRVLLGDFGCTHCHQTAPAHVGGHDHADHSGDALVMARQGPVLGEIGSRASAEWLRRWIADPVKVKPGTSMPRVLDESESGEADAIVHFLVSLGGPAEWEPVATEAAGLTQGRVLYHTVGCVACHGPLEPPDEVFGTAASGTSPGEWEMPEAPMPLGDLANKWRPGALAEFLKDPLAVRPSGRMPSMNLSDEGADFIATYLASRWNTGEVERFTVDPVKVQAGRAAFAAQGCASCHDVGGNRETIASVLAVRPLAEVQAGKGCMDPSHDASPRYGLSAEDRAALAAGIGEVKRAITVSAASPIDSARLTVEAFACRNCHEFDGSGGPGDALKVYFRASEEADPGDEGRLPPRLTGIGWKATTPWLRSVLLEGARARPYMVTRMPQFGEANVGHLPEVLALAAGARPDEDAQEPEATSERTAAGRTLVGEGGMNCISCHVFGDAPPAGTLGPDLTQIAGRVRYEWFKKYIMNPGRFKPGTKMTAFYHTADGLGMVKDVYGGEPDKQTDAIWAYFTLGSFAPEPEGLPGQDTAGMAIKVTNRPVVFRTFLKDAGSRGIAVGYPVGLHFAFDAEKCRLVDAWRGDFLDATGAWKSRGGQITGGRGGVVWSAPAGPAVAISTGQGAPPSGSEQVVEFLGYVLDEHGVPAFRTRIGSAVIEERFEPASAGRAVLRTFVVRGVPEGATVWVNAGAGVIETKSIAGALLEDHREVGTEERIVFGLSPGAEQLSFSVLVEVKEGMP